MNLHQMKSLFNYWIFNATKHTAVLEKALIFSPLMRILGMIITLTITDGAPYDGATQMTLHPNHLALVIVYSIAAVAGLVYAAACLLFNLLFRKKK